MKVTIAVCVVIEDEGDRVKQPARRTNPLDDLIQQIRRERQASLEPLKNGRKPYGAKVA